MTKSAMEFVSCDLSDLGSDKVCIKMFETVDHWDYNIPYIMDSKEFRNPFCGHVKIADPCLWTYAGIDKALQFPGSDEKAIPLGFASRKPIGRSGCSPALPYPLKKHLRSQR